MTRPGVGGAVISSPVRGRAPSGGRPKRTRWVTSSSPSITSVHASSELSHSTIGRPPMGTTGNFANRRPSHSHSSTMIGTHHVLPRSPASRIHRSSSRTPPSARR